MAEIVIDTDALIEIEAKLGQAVVCFFKHERPQDDIIALTLGEVQALADVLCVFIGDRLVASALKEASGG